MMTLIIGGCGSGKSAFAEDYLGQLSKDRKKYYIATMEIHDEEDRQKTQRHRLLRSGKGFQTVEQPFDIEKAVEKTEPGERTALLECISNLTANEMFSHQMMTKEDVTKKITDGIAALKREFTHLVIVSNNIFEDGNVYDETTMSYIRNMGQINIKLAEMADEVIEVVAGIPLTIKSQNRD